MPPGGPAEPDASRRPAGSADIEQIAGYAAAAAFSGHRLVRGATASYVKVGLPEVAAAFSQLWGEPHPCATHQSPVAPPGLSLAAAASDWNWSCGGKRSL